MIGFPPRLEDLLHRNPTGAIVRLALPRPIHTLLRAVGGVLHHDLFLARGLINRNMKDVLREIRTSGTFTALVLAVLSDVEDIPGILLISHLINMVDELTVRSVCSVER